MRVFVAHGYRQNELWVRDLVVPVLQALDIDVVTGARTSGEEIDDTVRREIRNADALIAFLQCRDPYADNTSWDTSSYVKDEVAVAFAAGKPIIRFVEAGVKNPGGGIGQNHPVLTFVLAERDLLLVELASQVRKWISGTVSVRLGPIALEQELQKMDPKQLPLCAVTIRHHGYPVREDRLPINRVGGGLFVRLVGFQPGRVLDLELQTPSRVWRCTGESHAYPSLTVDLA